MKSYSIAVLAGAAMAQRQGGRQGGLNTDSLGKLGNDPLFQSHISTFNTPINTVADFALRQEIFRENNNVIERQNAKANASGDPMMLRLKHNRTSTMTREEYRELLGLDSDMAARKATTLSLGRGSDGKRHLMETATNVDHFADGFMHPVKDQGNCGSCWSFGSNTTLEGTIAKKTNKAPVRLSEQHLVDCTLSSNSQNQQDFGKDYGNWGCQGGWMSSAWDFQIDHGAMLNSDYPYQSGNTSTEHQCEHDRNNIELHVKNYGQIQNSVDEMKSTLMKQPLSVAVDAGQSAFQFYSSGVVREEDNCGTQLNHAVVVVGYTDEEGNDEESEDEESEDEESEEEEEEESEDEDGDSTSNCTVEKWWHTCDDVQSDRRLSSRSNRKNRGTGNTNYWKVQNSWGTQWGDQGFILIGIEGGQGVCGINSVVEWVEAKNLY